MARHIASALNRIALSSIMATKERASPSMTFGNLSLRKYKVTRVRFVTASDLAKAVLAKRSSAPGKARLPQRLADCSRPACAPASGGIQQEHVVSVNSIKQSSPFQHSTNHLA